MSTTGQGHDRTLPETGRLCGGPLLLDPDRLQGMQIIGGALRMRGGGEDQTLVVLQGLQPRRDIGGVIFANLGG